MAIADPSQHAGLILCTATAVETLITVRRSSDIFLKILFVLASSKKRSDKIVKLNDTIMISNNVVGSHISACKVSLLVIMDSEM